MFGPFGVTKVGWWAASEALLFGRAYDGDLCLHAKVRRSVGSGGNAMGHSRCGASPNGLQMTIGL